MTVFDILIRGWRILAASALLSVAAAGVWTLTRPKLYEATTTLVVSASEPTPGAQAAAVTNARTLLENRRVADAVIRRFGLDGASERLTPDSLVRDRLQISQIRDTNFLRVSLRLTAPAIASEALAALVQAGIDLNQQLNIENTIAVTGGLIRKQLEEARRAMDKASNDLLAYQQQAQVDRLRTEAETALAQQKLSAQIEADLAGERSRVAVAERELSARPRHLSARRAISGEGPLLEDARRQGESTKAAAALPSAALVRDHESQQQRAQEQDQEQGRPATQAAGGLPTHNREIRTAESAPPLPPAAETPPMGLPLADPYADPVYEVLDYQAATGRTKLSGLEAQRRVLRRDAASDLFPRLYETELRLDKLRLDYQLASQVYKDLVLRFESARKEVMGRSVNIQVADPPIASPHPATPKVWLSLVVAAALGIGAALLGLMLAAVMLPAPRQRIGTVNT